MLAKAVHLMPNRKRLEYLDIAKGIGIILVVLGHILVQSPLVIWIYSFHMPLFFFLSGYLFYFNKETRFGKFLYKKVKSILIPYFIYAIAVYLYWFLIERRLRPGSVDAIKPLIGILYGIGKEPWLTFDDALWFLTCLFVLEVVFFLLVKAVRNVKLLALVLVISSAVGYFIGAIHMIDLPWSINIVFTAIVFYGAGYILHRLESAHHFTYKYMWLYLPPLIAVYAVCTYLNGRVDLNTVVFHNYFLFYGAAFGGLLSVYFLSRLIGRCRPLSFLGMSTMVIMCLHEPVKRLVIGVAVYITGYPMQTVRDNVWGALACTAITLALLIPFILLADSYLPFLNGRRRQNV